LIDHLASQAAAKPVNSGVSLNKYYACAQLLLRQAACYERAGVEEQEYVMLMRFASLMLETIPKHKDFNAKDAQHLQLKQLLASKYLPQLERLKLSLKMKDIVEPAAYSRNRPAGAVNFSTSNLNEVNWSGGSAPPLPPPVSQQQQQHPQQNYNLDDLLDVMQNGAGTSPKPPPQPPGPSPSQQAARQPTPSAPTYQPKYVGATDRHDLFFSSLPSTSAITRASSAATAPQPSAPPMPTSSSSPHTPLQTPTPPASLQRYPNLHTLHQAQQAQQAQRPPSSSSPPAPALQHLSLADGPLLQQQQQQQQLQYQQMKSMLQPHPSAGPTPPPQPIAVISQDPNQPGLPHSCAMHPALPPPSQEQQQPYAPYPSLTPPHQQQHASQQLQYPSPPPPSTAFQQEQLQLPRLEGPPGQSPTADGKQGGGMREVVRRAQLRDVHVSIALMEEFLAYARSNTAKGIESCGILAGQLSANDSLFTITTLIIPKQEGTTDTVTALNEEEVFDVQFSRELYPLGWIHTHPTQTCFLSSVDVHTHCGYQTMLEEAIAIVMAPNDRSKRCGLFRLSTPGGLQLVQRCTKRGFHPHPPTETKQDLYELCGHVYLNPQTKHEVIDLR